MNRLSEKRQRLTQRKNRIRARVSGTSERPRLTVFVGSNTISAQIIDDSVGKTLVSARGTNGKTMTEKAADAGTTIAQAAKKQKISKVVFDTNGRQYQQRLSAFAEAARKEGLEF